MVLLFAYISVVYNLITVKVGSTEVLFLQETNSYDKVEQNMERGL